MTEYKVIGIDLAKTKFHVAALNEDGQMVFKKALKRDDFFDSLLTDFSPGSHFAMEACGGSHYVAQRLIEHGHRVSLLKPKDVKPYAKSRQKMILMMRSPFARPLAILSS